MLGRILSLLMILAVLFVGTTALSESALPNKAIPINDAFFPDDSFQEYISENFDRNEDGYLSDAECSAVKKISVNYMGLESLEGISYFKNLKYLYARGNELDSLDVSANRALEELECSENCLSSLPVGNLSKLKKLCCYDNEIQRLNVGRNLKLNYLDCQGNSMVELYLGKNQNLKTIICFGNQLTKLDLKNVRNLLYLDCWNNRLTSLSLTNNKALKRLRVYRNKISKLDISKCTYLLKVARGTPDITKNYVCWGKELMIPTITRLMSGSKVLYQGS